MAGNPRIPVNSADQQAMAMLHRVRDQLVGQPTATINALRGHLTKFGLVGAQRRQGLRALLALRGELENRRGPPRARAVLESLVGQLRDLAARSAELDPMLTGSLAAIIESCAIRDFAPPESHRRARPGDPAIGPCPA